MKYIGVFIFFICCTKSLLAFNMGFEMESSEILISLFEIVQDEKEASWRYDNKLLSVSQRGVCKIMELGNGVSITNDRFTPDSRFIVTPMTDKSPVVLPFFKKNGFEYLNRNKKNGALLPFAVYGGPFRDTDKDLPFYRYFTKKNYFENNLIKYRDLEYVSEPFNGLQKLCTGLETAAKHYTKLAQTILSKDKELHSAWLKGKEAIKMACRMKTHTWEKLDVDHYAFIHSDYFYWKEFYEFIKVFSPKDLSSVESRVEGLLNKGEPDFAPQATIDIPINRVVDFLYSKYPGKTSSAKENGLYGPSAQLPKGVKPKSEGFLLLWGLYCQQAMRTVGSAKGSYSAHVFHKLSLRTDWHEYYKSVKNEISPEFLLEFTNNIVNKQGRIYRGVIGDKDWKVLDFLDYVLYGKNIKELPVGATGYIQVKQNNNIVIEIRTFKVAGQTFNKAALEILATSVWLQKFEEQGKGPLAKYVPGAELFVIFEKEKKKKKNENENENENENDDDEKDEKVDKKVDIEIPDFTRLAKECMSKYK
ncbi:MAG: hypothetical protein GY754_01145 [bacterium]|nr:hypothetical protein [bacterium]